MTVRVGLIGGRGFTGREILRLLSRRRDMELVMASSRELTGQAVRDVAPEFDTDLVFEAISPEMLDYGQFDAIILALPNGAAAGFLAHIDPNTVVIDLSADGRFDLEWVYGLPEIYGRTALLGAKRIANPGCYATCGQLVIAPLQGQLDGPSHVFGVSGYSGAGMTPSRKNDAEALKDNLMPYALSGHIHEREMSRYLQSDVKFTPHVAPFFSGLMTTVHMALTSSMDIDEIRSLYADFYADEPLIELTQYMPEPAMISGKPGAMIGGFGLSDDGRSLVMVGVLDNLMKGAAVQAMQNLSLALGLPEGEYTNAPN